MRVWPDPGLENNPGFNGSLGRVSAGDGALGYTNIRVVLKRRHFFYLLRSRYLVSTFGVGIAIPVSENEAGETFTGGTGVKVTLGGRFGIQIPITKNIELGIVDHWGVWWYGTEFMHSAFMSAYGMHLSVNL